MSKSVVSVKRTRVQKVCTLWIHDQNFSRDDVVFNGDKFSELPANPGSLIQILGLKQVTSVRDFQSTNTHNSAKEVTQTNAENSSRESTHATHSRRTRQGSVILTLDENGQPIQGGRDVDSEKSYIFVAKPMSADLKSKHPNLQVSRGSSACWWHMLTWHYSYLSLRNSRKSLGFATESRLWLLW